MQTQLQHHKNQGNMRLKIVPFCPPAPRTNRSRCLGFFSPCHVFTSSIKGHVQVVLIPAPHLCPKPPFKNPIAYSSGSFQSFFLCRALVSRLFVVGKSSLLGHMNVPLTPGTPWTNSLRILPVFQWGCPIYCPTREGWA